MRIIARAASARRVPWKNGLGSTTELATDASSPQAPWTWRLSIADVPTRAPFSSFPGIDRHIACLDGAGMACTVDGHDRAVPRDGVALAFAGEAAVVGTPDGPGVRDVNLMVARKTWRARMTLWRGHGGEAQADTVLVHRTVPAETPTADATAAATVRCADGSGPAVELAPGDVALGHGPVRVDVPAGVVVVVACLWRAGPSPGP